MVNIYLIIIIAHILKIIVLYIYYIYIYCKHKNISHIRGLNNNIFLYISGLFYFTIGFYEKGDIIKVRNSGDLIDSMGIIYHDKINNSIFTLVSEIKTPNIKKLKSEKDITKISTKIKMH